MMPQSIGPFRNPIVASTAAGIFQLADLVFVRDAGSRQHALDVGTELEARLRLVTEEASRAPLIAKLAEGARTHRTRTLAMFTELERTLALSASPCK